MPLQPTGPNFLAIPPQQANFDDVIDENFDRAQSHLKNPLPIALYDLTDITSTYDSLTKLPPADEHENCILAIKAHSRSGIGFYRLLISNGDEWMPAMETYDYLTADLYVKSDGNFPRNVWTTRNVAEVEFDEIGIRLSNAQDGNLITLPKGKYTVTGWATSHKAGVHYLRLYVPSTTEVLGVGIPVFSNEEASANANNITPARIAWAFEIDEDTVCVLQSYVTQAAATSGATTAGVDDICGKLHFRKHDNAALENLNLPPTITSNGGGATAAISIMENTTFVTTVTATDPEGDVVTYYIQGGLDSAKFTINQNTGALSFLSAPDRENPTDSNQDNIYEVLVRATDQGQSGGDDQQAISVTVSNVNESPTITSFGGAVSTTFGVPENQTAVGTLTATDPENTTITVSIVGGTDAAKFSVVPSTGVVTFVTAPNFEAPTDSNGDNIYVVVLRATDTGGAFDEQTWNVGVQNANDPPVFTSTANWSGIEHVRRVGIVSATDPEGQPVTYQVVGGADAAKFMFNGDVLGFVSGADFEVPGDAGGNNVYDVVIQASAGSPPGQTTTQNVTVTIADITEPPDAGSLLIWIDPLFPLCHENTTLSNVVEANNDIVFSLQPLTGFPQGWGVTDFFAKTATTLGNGGPLYQFGQINGHSALSASYVNDGSVPSTITELLKPVRVDFSGAFHLVFVFQLASNLTAAGSDVFVRNLTNPNDQNSVNNIIGRLTFGGGSRLVVEINNQSDTNMTWGATQNAWSILEVTRDASNIVRAAFNKGAFTSLYGGAAVLGDFSFDRALSAYNGKIALILGHNAAITRANLHSYLNGRFGL